MRWGYSDHAEIDTSKTGLVQISRNQNWLRQN
nr:MAG TPA: hypothetical protein [Caudoviricetes sp.]